MVNALILDKNDYALIIHNCKQYEDKRNNRWEFPGGKVEPEDKNLEEATIRELEEELGIKIKIIRKESRKIFGDYETTTLEGKFLCRTYHAKIISGEPIIQESERDNHDKVEYANYNRLLHLNEERILAPNLFLALTKLKEYME